MKKIRMLKLMAGPEGIFHPGQTVQLEDKTAAQLVADHAAVYVADAEMETAALQAPEKAVSVKRSAAKKPTAHK